MAKCWRCPNKTDDPWQWMDEVLCKDCYDKQVEQNRKAMEHLNDKHFISGPSVDEWL